MSDRAIVTADSGLRLRQSPVDGQILRVLPNGETIEVLEEVRQGEWLRVRSDSQVGFVSARFARRIGDDVRGSSILEIEPFVGSQFIGEPVLADRDFIPELERLNAEAKRLDVRIHVTHSFRRPTDSLEGTVVPPAKRSNHLVGHAIDMNLESESGFFDSHHLARAALPALPGEVRALIEWIRNDHVLRWGGDFSKEDPVHIDDALNLRAPEIFQQKLDSV